MKPERLEELSMQFVHWYASDKKPSQELTAAALDYFPVILEERDALLKAMHAIKEKVDAAIAFAERGPVVDPDQ